MSTQRSAARAGRGSRPGFVLMAALWLLVALGAVGLEVSLRNRTRRLATANLLDEARARTIAEAAVEYARSRLGSAMMGRADELRAQAAARATTTAARQRAHQQDMTSLFRQSDPAEDPWREPAELVPPTVAVGDIEAAMQLRDTGAAFNPNEADELMLRQFFAQGLRIDYALADELTQAILDWRDEDDLPRINGAEGEQYTEAGAAVLPGNRPFATLDELRHVLGMTAELFQQMRPYLTLVSSGRINLNAAPEPVLLALPGFTPVAATSLLRLRQSGRFPRSAQELRALLPASAINTLNDNQREFTRRSAFTTDEIEIDVLVDLPGSPVSVHALVVVARATTGASVVWRKIE
ncbi:MAG: general secretion pathway protein GspK [Longimicrobiales bacterium]